MSGARAAEASEALGLTSMMAWLGQVPRRAAGGRVMYRTVVFFSFRDAATVATSPSSGPAVCLFVVKTKHGPDPIYHTTLFQSGFTPLACTAARGRVAEARLQVARDTSLTATHLTPPSSAKRACCGAPAPPSALLRKG